MRLTKFEQRNRDMADLPHIRLKEGAYILGVSKHVWRRKWAEVYQFIVEHWETSNGTLLNLESLVAAVYPDTENDTQARTMVAHAFMWKLMEERKSIKRKRAEERAENQDATEPESSDRAQKADWIYACEPDS